MLNLRNTIILLLCLLLTDCYFKYKSDSFSNPYPDDYSKIATLANRNNWNGANIQDPSVIKNGDTYYLYSTDNYYIPPNSKFNNDSTVHIGQIPFRSSKDLVHWKFEGWVFDSIPSQPCNLIKSLNNGIPPEGITAPCIYNANTEFRLYYSVTQNNTNNSCIALATSSSLNGPWNQKGIVISTSCNDTMNAIDPSVIKDSKTGKAWMLYGSSYNGLYCLELNPQDGLALVPGNKGNCIARRSSCVNRALGALGAPEITYNKKQGLYYLFMSYDLPFSCYNIRVGRSKNPNGPFIDYFGKDLMDTTNNYPLLTYSYKFHNHPGWSGNGHCSVLVNNDKYFVLHQGRLAPENLMTQLHCREIKWLNNGWPVFSPERYNPSQIDHTVKAKDLIGKWETIELKNLSEHIQTNNKPLTLDKWKYDKKLFNASKYCSFLENLYISPVNNNNINLTRYKIIDDNTIQLVDNNNNKFECKVFQGWDWENKRPTILFSGINTNGLTVWGKKVWD